MRRPASPAPRLLLLSLLLTAVLLRPLAAFVPSTRGPPPRATPVTMTATGGRTGGVSSRQQHLTQATAGLAIVVGASTALSGGSGVAVAAVKASGQAESRAAALNVKGCLAGVVDMQKAAGAGEWTAVADILGSDKFQTLESTFLVLVRSGGLTAEDKVALGTIKRFGLTADALITLGGLESELRAGGVPVGKKGGGGGGGGIGIVDEGEEEEGDGAEGAGGVNGPEARRLLRLARGALEDIDSIASTLLEDGA